MRTEPVSRLLKLIVPVSEMNAFSLYAKRSIVFDSRLLKPGVYSSFFTATPLHLSTPPKAKNECA